jgi:hypothetical protein
VANSELLELLKLGVPTWNDWRKKNSEIQIDLLGADLCGVDLCGANFSGARLSGADLSRGKLRDAHFDSANLSGANLGKTDLNDANFSGAKLRDTDLCSADLTGACLTGADLSGAYLSGAHLDSANLADAKLNGATLNGANFSGAQLSGADFGAARLTWAVFAQTDLTNVKNLETCFHSGPSSIDTHTLLISKSLPEAFLRGCGLPDNLIEYLPSLQNRPIEFYSCFISYSHADKSFARRLHDQLQGRGIRCWLDEHQMRPGDDIYEEVQRGSSGTRCCSAARGRL